MDKETMARIVQNARNNSVIDLTDSEIIEMIESTEARLGRELTGLIRIDKPFEQFHTEEALKREYPKKKIASIVMDCLKNNPNMLAIECGQTKITRLELEKNVFMVTNSLKNKGIKKGDKITICSPSTPELIYYFIAADLIGAITRPIDPISGKETIRANLEATKSKMLITLDLNYPKLNDVTEGLECKVVALSLEKNLPNGINPQNLCITIFSRIMSKLIDIDENWTTHKEFIKDSINKDIIREKIEEPYNENDVYCIYSSSGTSGLPKGIVSTDYSMVASVYKQIDAKYKRYPNDKIFNPMPSYSTYFWNDVFYALLSEIPLKLFPLFTVENSVKSILESDCSIILLGPIILEKINQYIEKERKKGRTPNLSRIKHLFSGGDILRIELEKRTNKNIALCGSEATVENGYGTSETEGPALIPNGAIEDKKAYHVGSIGIPLPKDDLAIFKYNIDENSRNLDSEDYDKGLEYYEIGEICLNSANPEIFVEYYNDHEATKLAKITHNDGTIWYHTGDLGYMDPAGHIFCSGRKTGMIVRSGHKIWTSKINSTVRSIEKVKDCETIGVSDIQEQEVPILFIVFKKDVSEVEKAKIINEIKISLQKEYDSLHIPKYIKEMEEIPRNLLLKAKLKELKALAEEEKEKSKSKKKDNILKMILKRIERV